MAENREAFTTKAKFNPLKYTYFKNMFQTIFGP